MIKTAATTYTQAFAAQKQGITLLQNDMQLVPYKCCYLYKIEANFVLK